MKNNNYSMLLQFKYLFVFIAMMVMASCTTEEEDLEELETVESLAFQTNGATVRVTGPSTVDCNATSSVTLRASNLAELPNPRYSWSVISGAGFIRSGVNSSLASIGFRNSFRSGNSIVVRLVVRGSNGLTAKSDHRIRCEVVPPCTPTRPGAILFDTFEQGRFCTNTSANLLEVGAASCAERYIWTVSPSGVGVDFRPNGRRATISVFSPGAYQVSVVAVSANGTRSPARVRTLQAENCGGFGGGNF